MSAPADRPRTSMAPVVVLVPVTVLAATGAALALMLGYVPDPSQVARGWMLLYLPALLLGPLLLASLMFGYAWARIPLALLIWAFLAITLASLPALFAEVGSGALIFGIFVAVDLFGLRAIHGPRLREAVAHAAAARARRYPDGFGLALVAGGSALLGVPSSLVLLAADVRDAGGAGWLGGSSGPARLVLPIVGVSIAASAIARLARSRTFLVSLLGAALTVSALHAPFAFARHSGGAPFAIAAAAIATLGVVAATRPRFAEFCRQLARR